MQMSKLNSCYTIATNYKYRFKELESILFDSFTCIVKYDIDCKNYVFILICDEEKLLHGCKRYISPNYFCFSEEINKTSLLNKLDVIINYHRDKINDFVPSLLKDLCNLIISYMF